MTAVASAFSPEYLEAAAKPDAPLAVAHLLWRDKYAPELEQAIRDEQALRSDPFAEGVTFEVFGEELRLMTPRDLVNLDGNDNPFVSGGKMAKEDVVFFLWQLHRDNHGKGIRHAWRQGRFNGRVGMRLEAEGIEAAQTEIDLYMRRVLFDLPEPEKKDPNKPEAPSAPVNCVAGLLVDVAALVGPTDPFSGALLGDTPIPRLVQYRRARLPAQKLTGALERARVLCMEETNEVLRKIRTEKGE